MKILNDINFNEFINDEKLSVVDFYADWCGPCKMIAPILEELEKELSDVNFGKLNVDGSDISFKYGVMSIPTIMVFKKGDVIKTSTGLVSKDELKNIILNK